MNIIFITMKIGKLILFNSFLFAETCLAKNNGSQKHVKAKQVEDECSNIRIKFADVLNIFETIN